MMSQSSSSNTWRKARAFVYNAARERDHT